MASGRDQTVFPPSWCVQASLEASGDGAGRLEYPHRLDQRACHGRAEREPTRCLGSLFGREGSSEKCTTRPSHSWCSAASAPRPASQQHTSRCQCGSNARAARHCSSAPRRPLAVFRTASLRPALGLQQQSLPALWSRCLPSHSHLRPRPASTCISARRLLCSSNVRRRLPSPCHLQV
jgi:hypothetical protein